jgi:hypothetical protein
MPGIKAVGTNTESSTRVIAMIGPVTCDIAFSAASAGVSWGSVSRMCSTASTTTIASSTTIPIASTSARSEMVFAEKPSANITANVPTRATGTAIIGINVARKFPRKMKTTMPTSTKASSSVFSTLWIIALTKTVVSYITSYATSSGRRGSSSFNAFLTPAATAIALAPGDW